jgi:flagellar biosynthesis chaperone FliJ
MHEFEKYPELAEQMQEYASFGRFGDWQKFTDVLNEALRQASKNLVKADVIGQLPQICEGCSNYKEQCQCLENSRNEFRSHLR